jgi:hypothetical protein
MSTEAVGFIQSIIEVKELNYIYDTNAHLKLGWKLLGTFKVAVGPDSQAMNYCVGWPQGSGDIIQPEKTYQQQRAEEIDGMGLDF